MWFGFPYEAQARLCATFAGEKAKVEVVWPSGIHQTLDDVHADQFLEVLEPEKQNQ